MPTISRPRALLYATVVLVALVLAGRFLLERRAEPGPAAGTLTTVAATSDAEVAVTASTELAAELVVHVAGAVRSPGLYRLPAGSRVDDAIGAAGGPTRRAELDLVNLAQPLSDGEQVLIPARAGPGAVVPAPAAGPAPSGPLHLNSATLEELDSLPGVGPVTAQKILDYRNAHGPFTSVDELDAIPGIGPARLGQLRELVAP